MISYAEAKRRAQAAKPNWNEEEYITKAVIYWADAEYEYDLEVENEGDSDADFTAWVEAHAEELAKEGISVRVYDLHTIKPLDTEAVVAAARKTGCVVTAEEHQVYGGMGSAVAECLVKNCPVPVEMVAVQDSFGESGKPQELMDKYGLNQATVEAKIKAVLKRKVVR